MKNLIILSIALFMIQGTVQAQFYLSCLPDGITFTSQDQIDSFQVNHPGCTEIEGDVFFNGPDITNLHGLSTLNSIGGNLELTCLDNLSDLTGLDALTSISGNLGFHDTKLTDMTGLGSLTSIGGSLDIGCFANSSVICNNPLLENLSGLEALTFIGGQLYIADCQSLTDVDALNSLTSVGGINIVGNSNLTSLEGLVNLGTDSLSFITIAGNSSLSSCDVQGICNFLNNPVGEVNIVGNSAGCNSPVEIASACGISLPCLPYGNYYLTSQADVDSFQVNYPDCNELEGTVVIGVPDVPHYSDSSDVSNLNGLQNIYSVTGDLLIRLNGNLSVLTGLENLNFVGGGIQIDYNDSLGSLTGLESLSTIGNFLTISSNHNLTNVTGLEDLVSIGGALRISGNNSLSTLTGLESLAAIGGYLRISNNDSLNSLTGLDNVNNIGSNLRISTNPSLNTCDVLSICNFLSNPNGAIEIYNNDSGCNSQEEVEAACDTTTGVTQVVSRQSLVISYPNPTSGIVNLQFTVCNLQSIDLRIYNAQGQEVAVVLDQEMAEGEHIIRYDMSALPSGIYYYRLTILQASPSGQADDYRLMTGTGKIVKY